VTLTFHRGRGRVVCHYCGFSERRPDECPQCKLAAMSELGIGTERVEAALRERFPEARVARLDRDTGAGRGLRDVLRAMGRREIDILVGTQMVTKGHDFPGVTLVGVLLADMGLNLPDFRAAERVFQLLAQVAGRAGRGSEPGRVLVQTYNPDHPSIVFAAQHDYAGFQAGEVRARSELGYPPAGRLVALRIDGPDEGEVRTLAEELGRAARAAPEVAQGGVAVLGPAEAPLARLRGRSRWQLFLRGPGPERQHLRQVAWRLLRGVRVGSRLRVGVDVDPQSAL
jgi:primosomal protein N' (replication factor Y)